MGGVGGEGSDSELKTYTNSKAIFDDSDKPQYRYSLMREFGDLFINKSMCIIMLNPSTANATEDDPTIRRCVSFAQKNECGKLIVVNLFAIISSDPKRLLEPFPIGRANDLFIVEAALAADIVVVAWGAFPKYIRDRDQEILGTLKKQGVKTFCLGLTKEGFPRHPLYVKKSQELIEYAKTNLG